MNKTADIQPIKTVDYKTKQSHFDFMGALPTRSVLLGQSGTGKTTVMCNLLLNHYRGAFENIYIYIWSPTMSVDKTWDSVKNYCKQELKQTENKQDK